MKSNIGKVDKFLRVMISIPFIVYGIMEGSFIGLIGVVLLATAITGWCGLYALLKSDTHKTKDSAQNCQI